MGIRADIYRGQFGGSGDLSRSDLAVSFATVTIVNIDGPFEPDEKSPPVILSPGNLPGTVKAVPASMEAPGEWSPVKPDGMVGPMMGGAYVATSDMRFAALASELAGVPFYGAVALHDRFETPEYAASMD